MVDAAAAIARFEAELGGIRRQSDPYEHALAAHRLGLAYAETVLGKPEDQLRRALACFDVAASLLDPRFHPVEHSRVLTAAGSVRRSLGDPAKALELFCAAADIASGRVSTDESAAMANNIGLALLERGDVAASIERFDQAVERFDATSAEGRRGRASALHNRGLARATSGRLDDLVAAFADHDGALAAVGFDEAALHHGLVQHSRGVVASTLSTTSPDPAAAATWRLLALDAFTAALDVFVWPEHAVRHGMVSFNLGRMWAAGHSIDDLRQAMVNFEDAVTAFDPREQNAPWRRSFDSLTATEGRLAVSHPGWHRTDHLVALLHGDPEGALRLMRRRLTRWLVLPGPARQSAVIDLVGASARWAEPHGAGEAALALLLTTVMELPVEAQSTVLDALLAARNAGGVDEREALDRLVDRAIGDALNGPQRVFVRDHLVAGGYERP